MTRTELQALRARIDAVVRVRLAAENERVALCKGCGMPRSNWTPGCKPCWARHDNWIKGKHVCPYPVDSVRLAAEVRVINMQLEIDRIRDAHGDLYRWPVAA